MAVAPGYDTGFVLAKDFADDLTTQFDNKTAEIAFKAYMADTQRATVNAVMEHMGRLALANEYNLANAAEMKQALRSTLMSLAQSLQEGRGPRVAQERTKKVA